MIIQVKINTELVQWVSEQLGMDGEESLEFIKDFVGMLYFTGAFEAVEITPASSANVNIDEVARRGQAPIELGD